MIGWQYFLLQISSNVNLPMHIPDLSCYCRLKLSICYGSASTCPYNEDYYQPYICTSPIKVHLINLLVEIHCTPYVRRIVPLKSCCFHCSTSMPIIPVLITQPQATQLWNSDWSINGQIFHLHYSPAGSQTWVMFLLFQLIGCGIHMLYHFHNVSYVDNLILWPLIVMQPKLVAVSNNVTFAYPKAPLYPRLALGKVWDEVSLCYYWVSTFIFIQLIRMQTPNCVIRS